MSFAGYTRARSCVGRMHACAVNSCLDVVNFSGRAIAKEEPRIDRKLQEANVDRSKGNDRLQASRLRR